MITLQRCLLLDQKDYASFALVCRAWLQPAREALYYQVDTEYLTDIAVEKLAQTLVQDNANDKHVAPLIKHLYLTVDQYTEDAVKLILSQTNDIRTYWLEVDTETTSEIPGGLLPTKRHSRLEDFLLRTRSNDLLEDGGTPRRCEARAMANLPESLKLLHLFGVNLESITAITLPALRDLTIVPAAGFKSTIFKKTPPVEILRIGDLNVRELRDMFASIGNACEDLRISRLSVELEGYDFPNIPSSVRRLELDYVDMDCARLPSGLESLEWNDMKTNTYSMILDRLCDPEFFPCLKHFPILTYLTDRYVSQNDAAEQAEVAEEGHFDTHGLHDTFDRLATILAEVDLLLRDPQRAYAALEKRGLPRPSFDKVTDEYGCFYILECSFRAMNEE